MCGHNIINHDLNYVGQTLNDAEIKPGAVIDTLFLSPLLFPSKPYHALLKDDKLQYDEANNPLNDAIKAKDLFYDEIASFNQLTPTEVRIRERFGELICEKADLHQLLLQPTFPSQIVKITESRTFSQTKHVPCSS